MVVLALVILSLKFFNFLDADFFIFSMEYLGIYLLIIRVWSVFFVFLSLISNLIYMAF